MNRTQRTISQVLGRLVFLSVVLIFITYTIIPFYWAISTSFRRDSEISSTNLTLLPQQFTTENYTTAFHTSEFVRSIINSFIVAGSGTTLALILGSLGAYALGRYRFPGRSLMRYIILSMNLFPTVAVLPSLLKIVTELNVSGSLVSMIITYPIFTLPLTTWNMIIFFKNLPPDIEEAAVVDGASTFQLFYRILLPITLPVLLTTGLIVFVSFWSEYLLALTFTQATPDAWTATVAISQLKRIGPGSLMAASVLLSVPLLLIIIYTQRRFITNTTEGAVKG